MGVGDSSRAGSSRMYPRRENILETREAAGPGLPAEPAGASSGSPTCVPQPGGHPTRAPPSPIGFSGGRLLACEMPRAGFHSCWPPGPVAACTVPQPQRAQRRSLTGLAKWSQVSRFQLLAVASRPSGMRRKRQTRAASPSPTLHDNNSWLLAALTIVVLPLVASGLPLPLPPSSFILLAP